MKTGGSSETPVNVPHTTGVMFKLLCNSSSEIKIRFTRKTLHWNRTGTPCYERYIVNLTFVEPCIARLYFIQPTRCNLNNVLYYYYQCSTCFRRVFRPSSGAYKTVCSALGIVILSCCLPLEFHPIHTSGRQQERMAIPKAAHIVL